MPSPPRPVVRVRVPAKINLHLSVGPLRRDGFHELHTVFHAVDLHDEVVVAAADALSLTVTGHTDGVPDGDANIAWRAVQLLAREAGVAPNARMRIHKRIPVAGGMAGGSADAAGALLACRALWGVDVPDGRLAAIAAELGSDVPFQLIGGTAIGTGRGEALRPVDCATLHWVLLPAGFGIAAGDAYRELDRLRAAGAAPLPAGPPNALVAALPHGPEAIAPLLRNDLHDAAVSLRPELAHTLAAGLATGALAAVVSGSGPTCALLCDSAGQAAHVGAALPGSMVASGPARPYRCV